MSDLYPYHITATIWSRNPDLAKALTKCIADKKSATETCLIISAMAKERVTRNALIGKAKRMGLFFHSAAPNSRYRTPKADKLPTPIMRPIRQVSGSRGPCLPPLEPFQDAPDDLDIPVAQRRSLLGPPHSVYPERGPAECCFPVGDPKSPDFFYCGAATTDSPYCRHHTKIATTPSMHGRFTVRQLA